MADIRLVDSRPSGVDTTNPGIAAEWAKVRSDDDSTNWVLLQCVSKTEINVLAVGDTGLEGLMSHLDPDKWYLDTHKVELNVIYVCLSVCSLYGGIRCTVNGMVKLYSLYCAGENVGGMTKGKSALFKGGVLMALDGIHGELNFPDGTVTSTETIMEQLEKLNGTTANKINI